MKMYEDKPGRSEAYSIYPSSKEGWTREVINARRDVIVEYWYDSAQRLRRTRIRDMGSGEYWTEEEQEEFDRLLAAQRVRLIKNLYYKS